MLTRLSATCRIFAPEIKTRTKIMDTTVIIAIIISTIVALAILALVILLFYYHWRNQELLVNFSAFIRENLKLKDEVERLQDENDELNTELDEVTGGLRTPRRVQDPPTIL
jgi:sensor histidine kinase YesM